MATRFLLGNGVQLSELPGAPPPEQSTPPDWRDSLSHVQGQTPSIMFASKEVRHRRATDTETEGRVGSCTEEEEEPPGLQILHSPNAVEQQPVGVNSRLELHPDEFIRTQWVPRTRMPLSSARSSKSPNRSFASTSAARSFKQCGVTRWLESATVPDLCLASVDLDPTVTGCGCRDSLRL